MNEVKRLKDHIEQFENHNPGEKARVCGDDGKIYYDENFAVLLSDKIAKKQMQLQSERTLRKEAETKLHELQDAIDQIYNLDTNKPSEENRKMRFLVEANIRESRKRGEAK